MSVEPRAIADLIESFVNDAHEDARKFENSTPLDESGVWTLHQLAGTIYALGFADGTCAQESRERGRRQRKADADREVTP